MAREGFIIYHDWGAALEHYSDTEVGRIIRTLLTYSETGVYEEPKGNERFVMPLLKLRIDADIERYEKQSESRSESAKKRWSDANASTCIKGNAKNANASTCIKGNANDANININTNINTISPNGDSIGCKKRPTQEECSAYFMEIGGSDDEAVKFFDYFAANGWLIGKAKAPMKDWKAAARNWNRRSTPKKEDDLGW